MKPRKVMIHIESTNSIPISNIKKHRLALIDWHSDEEIRIDQITVQVVKETRKK